MDRSTLDITIKDRRILNFSKLLVNCKRLKELPQRKIYFTRELRKLVGKM